jgi:hypothetical protein
MADAARPLFMPAPRPSPRVSAEDAAALSQEMAAFGFGRPTVVEPAPEPGPTPTEPAPVAKVRKPAVRPARTGPAASAVEAKADLPGAPRPVPANDPFGKGLPLRLDVPEALWIDLKTRAVQRRVTVRWLVLEALEAAGYDVAARTIPLDGRRVR